MILYVAEASEARQVGDGWRKAANMLAQKSHAETEYESQLTAIL